MVSVERTITTKSNPIIYTAVFGDYDDLPKVPCKKLQERFDFLLFTDIKKTLPGWDVRVVDSNNALLSNRHCKMFPWLYFDSVNSFYIDGHVTFGENFEALAMSLLQKGSQFSVFRHRAGGSVASEFIRCTDNRKLAKVDMLNVLGSSIDFSSDAVECGFIFRNHNKDLVRIHAEYWWKMFNTICKRDQLLVNHAAVGSNLKIEMIDASFDDVNDYLRVGIHKNARWNNLRERLKFILGFLKSGLILK